MNKAIILLAILTFTYTLHLQAIQHALINPIEEHNFLPFTVNHQATDYLALRNQYLGGIPQGPTVDGGKAYQLRDFFATDMGSTVLGYFDSLTVQPNGARGLNRYNLSPANFRLWMAIKILSGADTNMYARSMASDQGLFVEFVQKTTGVK